MVNNIAVALSAGAFVVLIHWELPIDAIWNGRLTTFVSVVGIILCAISHLGANATRICVTKDWVVVLCKNDKKKLAGKVKPCPNTPPPPANRSLTVNLLVYSPIWPCGIKRTEKRFV